MIGEVIFKFSIFLFIILFGGIITYLIYLYKSSKNQKKDIIKLHQNKVIFCVFILGLLFLFGTVGLIVKGITSSSADKEVTKEIIKEVEVKQKPIQYINNISVNKKPIQYTNNISVNTELEKISSLVNNLIFVMLFICVGTAIITSLRRT